MRTAVFVAVVVAAQVALGAASIIDPQIVGGEEAQPHQFPWQVGVRLYHDDAYAFCGGALIHKRWVLTAARCVEAPDNAGPIKKIEIILGAHEIHNDDEEDRVTMTVGAQDPLQFYLEEGDIALVPLPSDAPLKEGVIETIRLPSKAQMKESFTHETVTISGWGIQHDKETTAAPKLRFVSNKVISNFSCKLRYFFLLVSDSNICMSSSKGRSPCNGDIGGPLVHYEQDGKPTLVGILSFGWYTCEWGWPSVYTRVTTYQDWINDHVIF